MNLEELGFDVREEKGASTARRPNPKHYGEHRPGLVAVSVAVPVSASIWAPVVVGPGVKIPDHAILRGPDTVIRHTDQLLVMGPLGRSRDWLTALFVPKEGGSREPGADIWVNRGCFCGTLAEFMEEVNSISEPHRGIYRWTAHYLSMIARKRLEQPPAVAPSTIEDMAFGWAGVVP